MADLSLTFGGDLSLGPTGDLALADGTLLTQQRVLRRLLTNPGGYIWQLPYGAGLVQFVGQTAAPLAIRAVAQSQILQEAAVANSPPPSIAAQAESDGTVTLSIVYTDALAQETSTLSFSV